MEILDIHQHLGLIEDFVHGRVEDEAEDPEVREFRTRTATMDRSGIHRAVIGPAYQYLMPNGVADTAKVNDRLAAFRDKHPERFPFAVGAIEPRQGEAALDEIRRIKRDLGMVGVLWHNRLQGCYVDSPWMRRCARVIIDEGMTNFVHCHQGSLLESPWRLERLAAEFPTAQFVVIDGLAGFEETELFFDICQRRENITFDTGMWTGGVGKINHVKQVLGAHRLIYGSGIYSYPMMASPSLVPIKGYVMESGLTDAEKQGVFSHNLFKILGETPLGIPA